MSGLISVVRTGGRAARPAASSSPDQYQRATAAGASSSQAGVDSCDADGAHVAPPPWAAAEGSAAPPKPFDAKPAHLQASLKRKVSINSAVVAPEQALGQAYSETDQYQRRQVPEAKYCVPSTAVPVLEMPTCYSCSGAVSRGASSGFIRPASAPTHYHLLPLRGPAAHSVPTRT